jgi:hypothetical protein
MDNQEITVKFPAGPTDFSLSYIVQLETDESSTCPLILYKIHFNIILPPTPQFSKTLSFRFSHPNTIGISLLMCVCHMLCTALP